MIRITITLGTILLLLGLGAYLYALTGEQASVTALIPAFFGVPIVVLGLAAARWPTRRAAFMHVVVVLAALGLLGSARGLMSLATLVSAPDEVARPAAVVVQSIMAVLCLAYLVVAVRSFIMARRASSSS